MASAETDRELVRRGGYLKFFELAWNQHIVDPEELILEPHVELIANNLQGLVEHNGKMDMVINVPPGTSKSRLCSIFLMPWAWIGRPHLKFMHTGYDEDLQLDFAEKAMNIITSDWYQERWPHIQIKKGARAAKSHYENTKGGARFSTMIGGNPTGKHADILMVDDPHKVDEVQNMGAETAKRVTDEAWNRFINAFSNRRVDHSRFKRCCIMQRLHVEDLAGKMLRMPNVIHICLPTYYEPHHHCVTPFGEDWRTEERELLCPIRQPLEAIEGYEGEQTPRNFASQHQQRPTPESGALFQREWFSQRWTVLPPHLSRMLISVDSSLKEGKDSDYCVMQVWGCEGLAKFYLLDQVRARMSFSTTIDKLRELRAKWPRVGTVIVEAKANGDAIVDTLRRSMTGVIPVNPEGGKLARANAIEPLLRAGNCWFPSANWVGGLVEEAITFPVGSNDDQIDAMSQALNWLSGRMRNQQFAQAMANVRAGKPMR